MRKIPATMATQHPDNARAPYWEKDGDGFVSTHEETAECYSVFKDLNCQEFMWDWEGKYVDEAVVDRLFYTYHDYFKVNQLGRDKFLTFRIPNVRHERGYGLARAMMGILTAENFARDLSLHTPPVFEVILPMTDQAKDIIAIQKTFKQLAEFKAKLFGDQCYFNHLNILPLIEDVAGLLDARKLLEEYLKLYRRQFKTKPEYLRLHIARSDPALNAGLVSAVVAGKVALSEYHRFGRDHKIKIFPAIGVGTLPFRGSLSPVRINDFINEYPGLRTVYIQSAFRYDFKLSQVKKAIKQLNQKLPKTLPVIYRAEQVAEAEKICALFSPFYKQTIEGLATTIYHLSKQVPSRRERKLHVGLFGYSRGIGKKRLPRAIPFTAVCYSLGIPPELIGTGRGLAQAKKLNLDVENYYFNFKKDLILAGRFLNQNNLDRLAKSNRYFRSIKKDVSLIEEYLGVKLGPRTSLELKHYALSTLALKRWHQKQSISNQIIASGKLRRSLG